MNKVVTIDIQDHVADVRLNRAEKMNALTFDMFEAITDAGVQLAKDKSIRAVVLSGEGRGFCAGLDLGIFSDPSFMDDVFGEGKGGFWPNFYQQPAYVWKTMPVPVICALHGVAYGGGLQIALGADIRIADPKVKMSVMEIQWGLIPDMSASQTLRDLVRMDIAKELTFTGRIVTGEEAQQIGLVTSLSESPRKSALEMASMIATQNPDAITCGKYLLENAWHGDQMDGLRMEEHMQEKLIKSKNQIEAVKAGTQKRDPKFSDREYNPYEEN